MTGIYDSGLGGLTAFRELRRLCPNEDIIYLGDTARLPYGTKSAVTIKKYALECGAYLVSKGIDRLLVACGTASANALDELKENLPVPITGVIVPASEKAAKISKSGKIAVIATGATVKSRSFVNELERINPRLEIFQQACPLFVPLVENGEGSSSPMVRLAVEKHLRAVREFNPDTVILGCTHYPIISNAISEYLPDAVLVSSGAEAAKEVSSLICGTGSGRTRFEVTDDPESFASNASVFLGGSVDNCFPAVIGGQNDN